MSTLLPAQAHLAAGADAVPLAAGGQGAGVGRSADAGEEGSSGLGIGVHVGIGVDDRHLSGGQMGGRIFCVCIHFGFKGAGGAGGRLRAPVAVATNKARPALRCLAQPPCARCRAG